MKHLIRSAIVSSSLLAAYASGCAPEFQPQSELDTLRILAVQKDKPYAAPGDEVSMIMLHHDADEDGPRDVEIVWFAGCENPPGDLYQGCVQQFAALADTLSSGSAPDGAGATRLELGEGSRFSFQISDDIISRRPAPQDPKQPRYGLAFVFYAVCAGRIELAPPDERQAFPIACFSPGGERLGAEDFVAGYSTVFVYDEFTNSNPVFGRNFEVDGLRVALPEGPSLPLSELCLGGECVARSPAGLDGDGGAGDAGSSVAESGAPDASGGDAGTPDAGSTDAGAGDGGVLAELPPLELDCDLADPRCILICDEEEEEDCPEITIKPVVRPRSAEVDRVLEAVEGTTIFEQMWVNYYSDRGSLTSDVRLLNDALEGWNDDYGSKLRAPKEPGPVLLWAVAHDNRGGQQWVRVRLVARRP